MRVLQFRGEVEFGLRRSRIDVEGVAACGMDRIPHTRPRRQGVDAGPHHGSSHLHDDHRLRSNRSGSGRSALTRDDLDLPTGPQLYGRQESQRSEQ